MVSNSWLNLPQQRRKTKGGRVVEGRLGRGPLRRWRVCLLELRYIEWQIGLEPEISTRNDVPGQDWLRARPA